MFFLCRLPNIIGNITKTEQKQFHLWDFLSCQMCFMIPSLAEYLRKYMNGTFLSRFHLKYRLFLFYGSSDPLVTLSSLSEGLCKAGSMSLPSEIQHMRTETKHRQMLLLWPGLGNGVLGCTARWSGKAFVCSCVLVINWYDKEGGWYNLSILIRQNTTTVNSWESTSSWVYEVVSCP